MYNKTAGALYVIGILVICFGIIGSLVGGYVFAIYDDYSFPIAIFGIVSSIISGTFIIGFSEILNLLQKNYNCLKEMPEQKAKENSLQKMPEQKTKENSLKDMPEQKVTENNVSIANNKTAGALYVIGILVICFGIIGSLVGGYVFAIYDDYSFPIAIFGIVSSIISGTFIIGFSEILNLLQKNYNCLKEMSEQKAKENSLQKMPEQKTKENSLKDMPEQKVTENNVSIAKAENTGNLSTKDYYHLV